MDDDLRDLALVLDEHRLDHNVSGWLVLPWRDGWNAVDLAQLCYLENFDEYSCNRERDIDGSLSTIRQLRAQSAEVYFKCNELLDGIHQHPVSPFLYAALRCVQILISNSSGGGHVYNDVLRRAFDACMMPAHLFEEVVIEARCQDAIGTTSVMHGNKHDRVRRAFEIAWRRGLFHAAYSLPRIK